MKTRKKLVISVSLIFIGLIVGTAVISAGTTISSVDYPTSVIQGEPIRITVYFVYSSTYVWLHGSSVELYYSINSLTIKINDFYVRYYISPRTLRPSSVDFDLPTSEFKAGDTLRFEIRYAWIDSEDLNFIIEEVVSDKYKINIKGSTNETTVSTSGLGLGIALITIAAISTRKKKVGPYA